MVVLSVVWLILGGCGQDIQDATDDAPAPSQTAVEACEAFLAAEQQCRDEVIFTDTGGPGIVNAPTETCSDYANLDAEQETTRIREFDCFRQVMSGDCGTVGDYNNRIAELDGCREL